MANNEEFWADACRSAEARCENQRKTIADLRYAGNEMARILRDLAESNQLDAISKACVIASAARWKATILGE